MIANNAGDEPPRGHQRSPPSVFPQRRRSQQTLTKRPCQQLIIAINLEAVATALNNRPRKTLNWKTPTETLNEYLHSLKQGTVARTP